MKQKWMIFRTEHSHLYYFWNGAYPISLLPGNEGCYWKFPLPDDYKESDEFVRQKEEFNLVLNNPRKKLFSIPYRPQRFVIVQRGEFTKPEE